MTGLRSAFPYLLLAVLLAPAGAARAAITAECVPGTFSSGQTAAGFNNGAFRPGQTFTAQVTGALTSIGVGVYSSSANDVVVELRLTSGGVPIGGVYASATIPGSPYADGVLHTADFSSSNVTLYQGVLYAVTLRTQGSSPGVGISGSFPPCGGGGTGDYVTSDDGGSTWAVYPFLDRSLVYRVEVQPAPPDPCVTAGCVPLNFSSGQTAAGFNDGAFRPGQTFTPQFSGTLKEVRLGLFSQGVNDAVVEIRTVAGNVPTTTVLGQATAPGSPYADNVLHVADFSSQNVVLNAGTPYAITLVASTGSPGIAALGSFPPCPQGATGTGDYVSSNDGGNTWTVFPFMDRSLVYEVCLDAPTPVRISTWGEIKTGDR
jgi:hypothetical protein